MKILLTFTINCDTILNVKRLTVTKKFLKKTFHNVLTFTISCDIVITTKQGRRRQTIEKYIILKLKIVIGLLLDGNIQQAIESIKDIIAYLEDYSNK